MSDPFVAEIRVTAFNFAPKGWAFCSGQIVPISQNTALFSLLGSYYGGDGRSTFALPNLNGRSAVGVGQTSGGGSQYVLGDQVGTNTVALSAEAMPSHSHQPAGSNNAATSSSPSPSRALARATPGTPYQSDQANNLVALDPQATTTVGTGTPHNNTPPVLALNYCIALQGVYPQRP